MKSDELIFRREALFERERKRSELGPPLRLSPRWARWAYHFVVLAFFLAIGFVFFGHVSRYVAAPVFVRGGVGRQPVAVVMLPVSAAHTVHAGDTLRLELDGFPLIQQVVTVDEVAGKAMEWGSALRVLGIEAPLIPAPREPVVVARAALPAGFDLEGRPVPYREGMRGTTGLRTHRQRIVASLVPVLARWLD